MVSQGMRAQGCQILRKTVMDGTINWLCERGIRQQLLQGPASFYCDISVCGDCALQFRLHKVCSPQLWFRVGRNPLEARQMRHLPQKNDVSGPWRLKGRQKDDGTSSTAGWFRGTTCKKS
ncbi:hypothetical protein E2C01_025149 [Portunus trituberculatus]|uniref:Uncharacterized protein n=1 Tax=Portunus trituberculatus TaxID=210409 RepID=A0A5B7EEY4_PORTR|nr:hypothetical protein [Portunus trituberculatus]